MPPDDFAIFTNATNTTSVVLQAHFLAIEVVLKPWLDTEVERDSGQRDGLTALPSSGTLTGDGPSNQLVRWPLKVLGKKAKKSETMIGNE
jgi:hypothetical protein